MKDLSLFSSIPEGERKGSVEFVDDRGMLLLVMPRDAARHLDLTVKGTACIVQDRRGRVCLSVNAEGYLDFPLHAPLEAGMCDDDAMADLAGNLRSQALRMTRHPALFTSHETRELLTLWTLELKIAGFERFAAGRVVLAGTELADAARTGEAVALPKGKTAHVARRLADALASGALALTGARVRGRGRKECGEAEEEAFPTGCDISWEEYA